MSQAGLIFVETPGDVATEYITDNGTAVPILNQIEIVGESGITTSASGKTVTVSNAGGVLSQNGINCSFQNLSWTITAGVLTISSADQTALSSTNRGYVTMRSSISGTNGKVITFTFTANQSLTVSDMTGNLFGTTTGVAWDNIMPMYIGLAGSVNNADPKFFITRLPNIERGGVEANMGYPSASNADKSYSIFLFSDPSDPTIFDTNVCILGGVLATKSSGNDWTVFSSARNFGVGKFNESEFFIYPTGQNGSATGSYFKSNGGTAPIFTTQEYGYTISRNGELFISYLMNGDGGTDGAGAVDAQLSLPIECDNQHFSTRSIGYSIVNNQGLGATSAVLSLNNDLTRTSAALRSTSTINVLNSDFSAGSRRVEGSGVFLAYDGKPLT